MKLKELFTVPSGEKITEKQLYRVLVCSICSILLCMTCLAGVTWAWFTVSIQNTGNEIYIGKPEAKLTVNGEAYTPGAALTGDAVLQLEHTSKEDDLQKKSTLYVTLTIQSDGATTTVYKALNESNHYSAQVTIDNETGKSYSFGWVVSWFAPDKATELSGNTVTLETVAQTQPTTQTETTEAATEAATQPSTEATTEAATQPATEATTVTQGAGE